MATYGCQETHESIVDDALEKLTHEAMKEVITGYRHMLDVKNIDKCIELDVSKIISPWIPDRYTEVDIMAMIGQKYTSIIAEFMTDGKTMMVVAHEAANPVEKCPTFMKAQKRTMNRPYTEEKFKDAKIQEVRDSIFEPVSLGVSPRGCGGDPVERIEAFFDRINEDCDVEQYYDPTSLKEDFYFGPRDNRGSKVETLPGGEALGELSDLEYFQRKLWRGLSVPSFNEPEVAKTNNLGIVDNPTINWSEISSVNMESAQAEFDAKGTAGWTQEYTITTTHDEIKDDVKWVHADAWNPAAYNVDEIEFTIDELDELIDLINEVQSEVMTFV